MDPKELASEYRNIKAFCRQQAAKSFKHPLAKQEAPKVEAQPEAQPDISDSELDAMMSEG